MQKFIRFCANFFLLTVMLYFGLLTAWYFAYSCDFFFPVTYAALHPDDSYSIDIPETSGVYTKFRYAGSGKHLKVFNQILQKVEHGEKDFDTVTFVVEKKAHPIISENEVKQLVLVTNVMDFYKSMRLFFLVMLAAALGLMIYKNIQPYRWVHFTRGMSVAFLLSIAFVWLIGVQNFFDILCQISGKRDCDWFFVNPKSMLQVLLPYPGSYVSFIIVIAVSGLAFWGLLFAAASKFIKFFIDKNYL